MADGIVRIVINAVDEYSGVITGLNQGIELASKAFNLLSSSATLAADGISAAIGVASKGGAYQEIQDQLENVAKSFGVSAVQAIKDIDRITLGMTRLPDAATLAGRGISIGLNESQLDKFFTFIKRRTELTGEDFKALSETVFTALASGRGKSVFASFGIAMEAGESLESLVGKLEKATERYGVTGFNTADKLAALSAQQENFVIKIGQAINKAPAFQKILTDITDTVVGLVGTFDPNDLVKFFDFIVKQAERAYLYVASSFPQIGAIIEGSFSSGETAGEGFAKAVINSFFAVYKAAGEVINGIIEFIQSSGIGDVVTAIGTAADNVVQIFASAASAIGNTLGTIANTVISSIQSVLAGVENLAASNETIAELLGVSAADIQLLDQNLEKIKRGIKSTAADLDEGLEVISGASGELFAFDVNEGLEKWKANLDDINAAQNDILDTVGKTVDEANKISGKPIAQLVKPQIDAESAEKTRADTDRLADQIKKASQVDVTAFGEGELQALVEKLFELEEAKKRFTEYDLNTAEYASVERQIEELRKRLQFKLTITEDLKGTSFLAQVKEYLSAVNWPSELQALGEFLLSFILLKARGERLPLAITTAG